MAGVRNTSQSTAGGAAQRITGGTSSRSGQISSGLISCCVNRSAASVADCSRLTIQGTGHQLPSLTTLCPSVATGICSSIQTTTRACVSITTTKKPPVSRQKCGENEPFFTGFRSVKLRMHRGARLRLRARAEACAHGPVGADLPPGQKSF